MEIERMIAINRNPNKNKAGNLFRCVETDYYISQHRYYLLQKNERSRIEYELVERRSFDIKSVSEDDSDRCPDGRIEILKVNGKMEILKVQLYFKNSSNKDSKKYNSGVLKVLEVRTGGAL
uniref:Uncharacterized protein n=1 Tax=Wuchereria bancrofti TaxID=6293 RepID=A0AAF5PWL1_WUCBA